MKTPYFIIISTLFFGASVATADPVDFGSRTAYGIVQSTKMSNETKKEYRAFKAKGGYFGAFFVNDETGRSNWVRNFHSLTKAQEAGKKSCEALSQGQGSCQLVALSYPKGRSVNEAFENGLSKRGRDDFYGEYSKSQETGKYGAFAVSNGPEYGYSWAYTSAKEAQGVALAECEAAVADSLVNMTVEQRNYVKQSRFSTCNIIDTRIGG